MFSRDTLIYKIMSLIVYSKEKSNFFGLNSDIIYQGQHQNPSVKGSVPQDCHPFRYQLQVVGSQITQNFSLTWLQIKGSHDLLLPFDLFAKMAHSPQENTYIYQSIK